MLWGPSDFLALFIGGTDAKLGRANNWYHKERLEYYKDKKNDFPAACCSSAQKLIRKNLCLWTATVWLRLGLPIRNLPYNLRGCNRRCAFVWNKRTKNFYLYCLFLQLLLFPSKTPVCSCHFIFFPVCALPCQNPGKHELVLLDFFENAQKIHC